MKPKKIVTKNFELNQIQDYIAESFGNIPPLVFGMTLLGPLNLRAGDNTIVHKLQRALQGWIVVRRTNGAVIFDKQTTNKFPEINLILNSSVEVTVWLLVF